MDLAWQGVRSGAQPGLASPIAELVPDRRVLSLDAGSRAPIVAAIRRSAGASLWLVVAVGMTGHGTRAVAPITGR